MLQHGLVFHPCRVGNAGVLAHREASANANVVSDESPEGRGVRLGVVSKRRCATDRVLRAMFLPTFSKKVGNVTSLVCKEASMFRC